MKWALWIILAIALLGGLGAVLFSLPNNFDESNDDRIIVATAEPRLFPPEKETEGGYNGPLFLTGEKIGDSAPTDLFIQNMTRNGVNFFIGYFMLDPDDIESDLDYLTSYLERAPGHMIPFYSTGRGGEEEGQLAGETLTTHYQEGRKGVVSRFHGDVMQGLGELEIHDWGMPPDDPRVFSLFDFAQSRQLAVMFHMLPGQDDAVDRVLSRYPETTFLIHLYATDFSEERENIMTLMTAHPNLYFTIDADHLLFDPTSQVGLLYKYQDEADATAVAGFVNDFDRDHAAMLERAVERYKPLVGAHPTRVTVGTELSTSYSYDPQVYDRVIPYLRRFIAAMDEDDQLRLGYQNALNLFGSGLVIQERVAGK
jgi:hypothetical protein